jgi:hypothetical protein
MEDNKEQKFKDFESGKINFDGKDLMEYMSKMYLQAGNVSDIVLKMIKEKGKMYVAKQLIIFENTKKDTPTRDLIIKGLSGSLTQNIQYLAQDKVHDKDSFKKIKETIEYADLLSICNIEIKQIDILKVQIAYHYYDFYAVNEMVGKLEKEYSNNNNILQLVSTMRQSLLNLNQPEIMLDQTLKTKINLGIKLTEDENKNLIEAAYGIIENPIEYCKLMNFYQRNKLNRIYTESLDILYNYGFYEGMKNNNFMDMLIDFNLLIFLNPQAQNFGGRAFAKWKNDDPIGAKNDLDKAFEIDPNFIDPIQTPDGNSSLIKDILKKEIDEFFSSQKN